VRRASTLPTAEELAEHICTRGPSSMKLCSLAGVEAIVACLSDSSVVAERAAHCSQRESFDRWFLKQKWQRRELGGSCEGTEQ
jgi:hypothetical protein